MEEGDRCNEPMTLLKWLEITGREGIRPEQLASIGKKVAHSIAE